MSATLEAEILRLRAQRVGPTETAVRLGVELRVVRNVIQRARRVRKTDGGPFKVGLKRVSEAVALADQIGVHPAARQLRLDPSQLCKWRKKLRAMEPAA